MNEIAQNNMNDLKSNPNIVTYNFISSMKDDIYIDCKDTMGCWCVAQIISAKKEKIQIHYIGWSKNYDEVLDVNSNKIAPFRRFSYGYTGQQSNSLYFKELSKDYLKKVL